MDDPGELRASARPGVDEPRGRLIVATTVLGSAVAMLTATVVNVALPALASDLGASSAGQKWVINAYLLTLASFILVGGALGDRYGRRRIYLVGVVWFGVASVACALAPNVEVLIVCRLFQGVGGALLTPGSLAIIEASIRPDHRGRAVGSWSGLTGIAAAVGPLVGGLLVQTASWRWVFLLNLPLVVVVVLFARWVPETRDPNARGAPLDLGGALLSAVFLGSLSFALIEGPEEGWTGLELGSLATAAATALLLYWYERRLAHPTVPFDLFANRSFVVANLITLLVYGGMGVLFFMLSVYLQVAGGWAPTEAGASLLPVTVVMFLFSAKAGALAQRIGPRLPLTVGPIGIALGMVLMVRLDGDPSFLTEVLPATLVFATGLVITVAPVTSTALGAVPDSRSGAASGFNNTIARAGGSIAVVAVPAAAGLTGEALNDPSRLQAGFDTAMVLSALIIASGGVVGWFGLVGVSLETAEPEPPAPPEPSEEAATAEAPAHERPVGRCPLDGPAIAHEL